MHNALGLWRWSQRGDKRPAWLQPSGSVVPPRRTKGRRWPQQELQLENFVLELLWVMNPRLWGDSCQPGPGATACGGSATMGEAAFRSDPLAVSGTWFHQCAEQGPAMPGELASTMVQAKAAGRVVRMGGRAQRRHPQ